MYLYVHNNPVNLVDPTGKIAWWIPTIGIGLIGAASCIAALIELHAYVQLEKARIELGCLTALEKAEAVRNFWRNLPKTREFRNVRRKCPEFLWRLPKPRRL